jgi:hypothetical protein
MILFASGGHGFGIRGDASFVEVKQGRYLAGLTTCASISLDGTHCGPGTNKNERWIGD